MAKACAALVLLAACLGGCASEGVRVTQLGPLPGDGEATLFVVASRQKPRIEASLRDAGFQVVDDLLATPYFLRVTVGTDKGRKSCGALANVKYDLRHANRRVLELAAAGWTGACPDNVFDAMSRRLMAIFEQANAREAPP